MVMQKSAGVAAQKTIATPHVENPQAPTFEHVQIAPQSAAPFCGEKTARPTQDQISTRAYELYVAGGSAKGQCKENWARAEKELRDEPDASSVMKS